MPADELVFRPALALLEMFEQLEPMRMGKRVCDLGESCKNPLFRRWWVSLTDPLPFRICA